MQIVKGESFKNITTFKIGGKIQNLYLPQTIEDLRHLFGNLKRTRFYIIGGGSNILANDREFKHVISMRNFREDLKFDENYLIAYAGCPLNRAVVETVNHGLSGMEFLIGIPGLIGGAIIMNAGCFGHEISEIIEEITFLNTNGKIEHINNPYFSRRYCNIQEENGVIVAGKFRLTFPKKTTKHLLQDYITYRKKHHPSSFPSAGGIFKNYELLQHITVKEYSVGDAELSLSSTKPNWILNKGEATFSDVMQLITTLQRQVKQETGETLELEVKVFK